MRWPNWLAVQGARIHLALLHPAQKAALRYADEQSRVTPPPRPDAPDAALLAFIRAEALRIEGVRLQLRTRIQREGCRRYWSWRGPYTDEDLLDVLDSLANGCREMAATMEHEKD
jgi:hypothetical protein